MQPSKPQTICPDQARELLEEYLEPLVEGGAFDELFRQFVGELAPLAAAAASKALRNCFINRDAEAQLIALRRFLGVLSERLDVLTLNPDAIAGLNLEEQREILEARIELQNWVGFLDAWPADPLEPSVPPTADILLHRGSAP
jgi:hypothetical protein